MKLLDSIFFTRRWLNGTLVSSQPRDLEIVGDGITHDTSTGRSRYDLSGFAGNGIAVGSGTEVGQKVEWDGTVWVKRRNWITPDVDLTGSTDATAAINAALASRAGACVQLPDGVIRMDTGNVQIERGKALVGRPRRMDFGHLQYNQVSNVGTLIKVYSTSKLFLMSEQSSVEGLSLFYPNQPYNSVVTPIVHDYAFYAASGNHGVSICNINAINPYRLIYIAVNGATVDGIQGAPISRGIDLGRCAEVVRVSRVLFNPGGPFMAAVLTDNTLANWVAANGTAFSVDGAEAFDFTGCFAGGYNKGVEFADTDTDNATSYGRWSGGGIEGCKNAFYVAADTGLAQLLISDCALVGGDSSKSLIDFSDSGASADKPRILATNITSWGPYDAVVKMAATSNGRFVQNGGMMGNYTGFAYRGTASVQRIVLNGVGTTDTSRISAGGAITSDLGGWLL